LGEDSSPSDWNRKSLTFEGQFAKKIEIDKRRRLSGSGAFKYFSRLKRLDSGAAIRK
jgi:hypothetical protein